MMQGQVACCFLMWPFQSVLAAFLLSLVRWAGVRLALAALAPSRATSEMVLPSCMCKVYANARLWAIAGYAHHCPLVGIYGKRYNGCKWGPLNYLLCAVAAALQTMSQHLYL